MKILKSLLAAGACVAMLANGVLAAQINVSYSVSGGPNNWLLDFSVTNNVSASTSDMGVYFFGVQLPGRDIVGSPSGWNPDSWTSWDNTSYGGTSGFNNNWLANPTGPDVIVFGQTLSGFEARVTTETAPASVDWFAFAFDGGRSSYTGSLGDTVYDNLSNPGFEGSASASIPEPSGLALLGLALAGLAASRRRKQ